MSHEKHPLFRGTLNPDVTFLGFDLKREDAIADPERAFNTSKKYVEGLGSDPQKDEIQRKVLDETLKLWQAPVLGRSDPAKWDQTQQVLIDMGLLQAKIPNEQLFTNQFVDAVK